MYELNICELQAVSGGMSHRDMMVVGSIVSGGISLVLLPLAMSISGEISPEVLVYSIPVYAALTLILILS